jgi:hypothetical protein
MKLSLLTRKGNLLIPVALTMVFSVSCDFLPMKMQDALNKGSNTVLAGGIRKGKQVASSGETVASEERTSVQAVQSTPRPANSGPRRDNFSSGQVKLPASAAAVTGTAMLRRGNDWTKGIPGFGENIFPCFFGEYQLNLKSDAEDSEKEKTEKTFSVRASKEPLLFSEENWQRLPPIRTAGETPLFPEDGGEEPSAAEGYTAMRRLNDENYITALILNETVYREVWRVFFQFPQDGEGFNLNTAQINRLIGEWVKWFLYFRASAQNPGELSFPAALVF